MNFPETPASWEDVAFAVAAARREGYLLGHRHGHKRGWDQGFNLGWNRGFESGVEYATARDLEFAHVVAQEYQTLELQGERGRDLVRRLISAAQTAENRAKFNQQFERRHAA
ncbi:hypothetical protein AB0365_09790 [Brevibacterium casei]|uniref:hypothetical protein n=1 Tax=Brevibacterium casei TaxID=33889 RepID=UPI00344B2B16